MTVINPVCPTFLHHDREYIRVYFHLYISGIGCRMTCQIGNYKVDLRKKLGRGHFGIVYQAEGTLGTKVAAKQLDSSSKFKATLKELANAWKQQDLDHMNIVKIFEIKIEEEENELWMFMEYCSDGDLNKYSMNHYDELQKIKVNLMKQMASGLAYLHDRRIAHRDIKPENILLQQMQNLEFLVVKLTDFGLAKFHSATAERTEMTTNIGTQNYKAPEFWDMDANQKIHYHKNVDIYALSLTYLALVTAERGKHLRPHAVGCDPSEHYQPLGLAMFNRNRDKKEEISVVEIVKGDDEEMCTVKRIIQRGTSIRPDVRPTAEEIVAELQVKYTSPANDIRTILFYFTDPSTM